MHEILEAYAGTAARSRALWAAQPGAGPLVPPDHAADLLGVCTGRRIAPTPAMADLHAELAALAAADPLLDLVPLPCLHITFLALAPQTFARIEDLPPGLDVLRRLHDEHVRGLSFRLSAFRIVPLANGLLLAGIPDAAGLAARAAFARAVLASPWAPQLRLRYGNGPIPPLFWHSTLVRSATALAPPALRELEARWRDRELGGIDIDGLGLAAITYNWSRVLPLA